MATDITITEGYLRAIAKVAFHYALKVSPDLTGTEWEFNRIKDYIWSGAGGGRERPVRQPDHQFYRNFQVGYRPKYWTHITHILGADRPSRTLVTHVQFFAGPRSLPLPFRVALGRNPSRIAAPRADHAAHLFVMDPARAGDGYTRVMDEAQISQYIISAGVARGGSWAR